MITNDVLRIAGVEITNRLFIGSGKFPNKALIKEVLRASQAQVITVALRRVDADSEDENILDSIPKDRQLLINTSGARTAKEAIRIARLAKAAGCGNWIKLEVIADNKYLLPDNLETLKAIEVLSKEDFVLLPYVSPDLSMAKRMQDLGAAAIMPLGAPIGSKRGIKTKELVKILIKELTVPVVVDAGIGYPSEAASCMEMGCDAVLVNTAIATARDPIQMAQAFTKATEAGRIAYHNATQAINTSASASSPLTGFLHES